LIARDAMTTAFAFSLPTRVRFGAGVRAELPELLGQHGWRRAGVVVDHHLRTVPLVQQLIDRLSGGCEAVVVAPCEVSEPTYDALEAMRPAFAGQRLDVMVAIGGGSALDAGKAMAALVHNRGPALSYRGFDKLTEPVLPIVAMPTTAGTGSEVTPNASFVDAGGQRKLGINGEAVRPRHALLDPDLTLTCPVAPTISAAVDSLVHATEAYVARKTNPLARVFAREGFARVFAALPRLVRSPHDLELRTEVMYGAFLAGVALMHSGTGPAAAMSYPLGVLYAVPHGFAGGTFVSLVARANVVAGVHDYADLYDALPGAEIDQPRPRRAAAFVDRLHQLLQELDVLRSPTALGLTGAAVDRFVADTLELKGALEQNPAVFGEPQIRQTLAWLAAETA
jgi:alcohol dehydrogenase